MLMRLTILQSVRTNNFTDKLVMQKISGMWKEVSGHLTDHEGMTYGVYHEYERDYKGDYTLSVAIEINEKTPSLEIQDSERFEIFTVDSSDKQGIFKTWQKIWTEEEEGRLERAYSYDYEKYSPNGEIEIHIAIRQ